MVKGERDAAKARLDGFVEELGVCCLTVGSLVKLATY